MKDLSKVIYVMGAPGAGKGTQADLLAKAIGYDRFSTGAAFREISQQDTPLGREVKELIDNGRLAPPPLAAKIVIKAVEQHFMAGRGIVFDGTPRTVEEATTVDAFFKAHQYSEPLVILLKIDEQEMRSRTSKRLFCLDIPNDFPVITDQDKQRCQELGGRVGVRPDDEEKKLAIRWDVFNKRTMPAIALYRRQGALQEIDGVGSIAEVHHRVMHIINSYEYPLRTT